MPLEIEAKIRVSDHVPIRQRLVEAAAGHLHRHNEINTFLDTPDHRLQSQDSGLRVRRAEDIDTGVVTAVITHKGPRRAGLMKTRPETEVKVASYDGAVALLQQLGYVMTLSFEKRRESWSLGGCEVELDELPQLGRFVEIEGPDEARIAAVQRQLGLENEPLIQTGYATMVAQYLARVSPPRRTLTFADSPAA
jgi:adenylate cyclase, class 2